MKKYSAKVAQEQSTELLFTYMVGLRGGFEAVAVVIYVKADSIEVIFCDTGIKLKVYLKDVENVITSKNFTDDVPTLTINWATSPTIQVLL